MVIIVSEINIYIYIFEKFYQMKVQEELPTSQKSVYCEMTKKILTKR